LKIQEQDKDITELSKSQTGKGRKGKGGGGDISQSEYLVLEEEIK
jgi:hypothetical protein